MSVDELTILLEAHTMSKNLKLALHYLKEYTKEAAIQGGSLKEGSEVICDLVGSQHIGIVKSWDLRAELVMVQFSNGQVLGVSYADATLANPPKAPFDPDTMLRQLRKEVSKMTFPKSMPVAKIYLEGSHPHGATIWMTGYGSKKVTQRIGKLKLMKQLGFEFSSRGGVEGSLVLKDGSGYNYTIRFGSSRSSSQNTDLWYYNSSYDRRRNSGW